jgi:uncharacterized protein YdeI (YjbR/CyaY-like superfamily)
MAELPSGSPSGGEVLCLATATDWADWLGTEHDRSPGVWLTLARKGSGYPALSYAEALDAALCFGWIDGQKRPGESGYWLQRFTRRSARSRWSKVNRARAEQLIASGAMHPAGRAEVARAQAYGRWDAAYDGSRSAQVPDDLLAAIQANPAANEFFVGLDRANRYAILYRVQEAKRPQTRERRIATFVDMLAAGQKIHP